ncbi:MULTISPECIES: trans-sulfuration enzyme family protein [unclassified Paraflavitalea]|uniref:trans-sulfuration enzyme family protein n=1 Tax=unclassified Paraflavitalea TaxID=2798305 RepID=UPI003D334A23
MFPFTHNPATLSLIINELGEDRENYFNAVAPPIIQTSNFAFKKVDELRAAFQDEMSTYLYSRGINPTVDILRKKLAALDEAEDALVFNNGAAAVFAGVLANVKAGDHIVSVQKPYTWAFKMFENILPRFGVTTSYIPGLTIEEWKAATRPNTTFFYLESPNSWNFTLQPLEEIAQFARERGIVTLIDNSHCSPLFQKPISLGIDLAMQTATKYISGHSDTLGGVLTGTKAMMKKIFDSEYNTAGAGMQPFNAFLMLRGLRTIVSRFERITTSTLTVLDSLKQHPAISELIFPFDASFPQFELAKKQMTGACGLITIILKAKTRAQIVTFCESLRHILMAVSWGGHESLAIPKCAGLFDHEFDPGNREHQMVRIYVGLEDPHYLIQDLEQAFAKANLG